LTKNSKEIEVKGEVIGTEERTQSKSGGSYHVTIPKGWRGFFNAPILELKFVKTDGLDFVIVISKPKGEEKI